MYIYVVQKSAQAIDCSDPPGEAPLALDSNPSVKCSFSDPIFPYQFMIGFSVFLLVGLWMPYRLRKLLKETRNDHAKYNDP